MKNEKIGRFARLIELFSVEGKDLAAYLHVDPSMISKWKTKNRTLDAKSAYLDLIVDYFSNMDENPEYINLIHVLKSAFPGERCEDKGDVKILLNRWLLDDYAKELYCNTKKNKIFSTQDVIYYSDDGRVQSAYYFMDLLLSLPEGQEIFMFTNHNRSWRKRGDEFVKLWRGKYREILKKHKLYMICVLDKDKQTIEDIFIEKLFLMIAGNTKVYYFNDSSKNLFIRNLVIINNHSVGVDIGTQHKNLNSYYHYFKEGLLSQHYLIIWKEMLASSKTMMRNEIDNCGDFWSELIKNSQVRKGDFFFFSDLPSCVYFNDDILKSIALENQIPEDKLLMISKLKSKVYKFFDKNDSYKITQIIDLSKWDQPDKYLFTNNYLSAILGRPIIVSRKIRWKMKDEVLRLKSTYSNYRLSLVPNDDYFNFPRGDYFIESSGESSLLYGKYKENESCGLLYIDNYLLNGILRENLQRYWDSISAIFKDEDEIIKMLD